MRYHLTLVARWSELLILLTLIGCATRAPEYPNEWWQPVSKADGASWEILPQEAAPGEVILSKRNELGILSNFAATPFMYEGVTYASVEGFWQMMKYPEGPGDARAKGVVWPHTRDQVAHMTGFEAKHAGDAADKIMKKKKIDWVTYKGKKIHYLEKKKGEFYRLIREVERAKLDQNVQVAETLKRTGNLILRPDHFVDKNVPPAWKYNEIWMEIRVECGFATPM